MGFRDEIRASLIESFKPRLAGDDTACAICGIRGKPLAYHMLQYAQPENEPLPKGFVPYVSQQGSDSRLFPGLHRMCTAMPLMQFSHSNQAGAGLP